MLAEAEASLTWARSEEYRDSPLPGNFDLEHLQTIHKHLFQDVYSWAGEIRSYDFLKNNCVFTPAELIIKFADQTYDQLKSENYLQNLPTDRFIRRLAYYYDITNKLHPFPEGNGRTQRLFIEHLAKVSGYDVDWVAVHPWEVIAIAERSFEGNIELLSPLR